MPNMWPPRVLPSRSDLFESWVQRICSDRLFAIVVLCSLRMCVCVLSRGLRPSWCIVRSVPSVTVAVRHCDETMSASVACANCVTTGSGKIVEVSAHPCVVCKNCPNFLNHCTSETQHPPYPCTGRVVHGFQQCREFSSLSCLFSLSFTLSFLFFFFFFLLFFFFGFFFALSLSLNTLSRSLALSGYSLDTLSWCRFISFYYYFFFWFAASFPPPHKWQRSVVPASAGRLKRSEATESRGHPRVQRKTPRHNPQQQQQHPAPLCAVSAMKPCQETLLLTCRQRIRVAAPSAKKKR